MKSAPNPLFRLVVVASAAFLITVLMMIVSAFSESSATAQWMNRNGVKLIGVEVVLVIVLSVLAMKFDRSQSLAEQDDMTPPSDLQNRPNDDSADAAPQTE